MKPGVGPIAALALAVLIGCSTISVKPDGTVQATAIGQSSAEHCLAEGTQCTTAEGGPLSDGFVSAVGSFFSLLEKAVMAIPRFFAGGAAAVAGP